MNWTRPSDCVDNACPEWQVDPDDGTVWLRASGTPDVVIKLRRDEWAALLRAAVRGEVTALP